MQSPYPISCIIPFFNEGERIFPVLRMLKQIPEIAQIICIDDGSKDNTGFAIKKTWPEITLISMPEKEGKSTAIKQGLAVAKTEYVLLMDADLQWLNGGEIQQAIVTVQQEKFIDMLILRRITAPWFFKIDRRDVLFSGERILRKADLERVMQNHVSGYQLEIAINQYMLQNHKMVRWMPWSASNTHKVKKWGLAYGAKREISMFREMLVYAGFMAYLRQILVFARKKVAH